MKIIKRLKLQHKKLYVSLIVLLCMFSFDDTTATKSDLEIGDNNEPPSSSIRRQRRITLEWNQNKTQHDEIDCSRFENLEQLPPFCWNETTEAPAVRPPTLPDGILPPNPSPVIPPPVLGSTSPQYPNSDTGSIVPANNEIQVAVSMGVLLSPWNSLTETRLSEMGDLVSLVMTILLDRYSPFHVDDDSGNEAVPSETKTDNNNNDRRILLSDTNNQLRLQTQTQTKTQRLQPHAPEAATISSTKNKQQKLAAATSRTDPQKQQHEQRRRRQVTSVNQTTVDDDQIPWPRNASTASLPLENPEHVANLYLGAIIIKKTPLEDEQEIWYGAMVNYTVFWPNTVPISAPILLREITKACAQVLELSIESGHFWKELQLQDDSEKNLVVDDYGKFVRLVCAIRWFCCLTSIYGYHYSC